MTTASCFDSENPFPLYEPGSYTYAEAKAHAVLADQWLGFELKQVEEQIFKSEKKIESAWHEIPQERWTGLDVQSLLTPYLEIRSLLKILNPQIGQTVVDLGCAYGRMAHVMGRHCPYVSFIGYELVALRVQEALRSLKPFAYPCVHIEEKDLTKSKPPPADYYFIYDFGSNRAIEKTLQDLKEISLHQSSSQKIKVIGRGRASRFLIQQNHAWLSEVHEPQHFENFSIYQS